MSSVIRCPSFHSRLYLFFFLLSISPPFHSAVLSPVLSLAPVYAFALLLSISPSITFSHAHYHSFFLGLSLFLSLTRLLSPLCHAMSLSLSSPVLIPDVFPPLWGFPSFSLYLCPLCSVNPLFYYTYSPLPSCVQVPVRLTTTHTCYTMLWE